MMRHESVQQCQLSESEVRGFIAEAVLNEDNEIAYIDHIKTWVPIIFELRKSKVYDSVTAKDWGMDAGHLVDLDSFDVAFPLIPPELAHTGKRKDSLNYGSNRGSRRNSRSGSGDGFGPSGSRRLGSDFATAARLSKGLHRASQRFMGSRKNSKNSQRSGSRGEIRGSFRER